MQERNFLQPVLNKSQSLVSSGFPGDSPPEKDFYKPVLICFLNMGIWLQNPNLKA
jgi:hypothetical protein